MLIYRRIDRAWARCEEMLIVGVLLSLVLVACFSAAVRNLTHFDIAWANAILTNMEWVDSFLHKGTTLLAFLGASQATYQRKHISIDVLVRLAPPRLRLAMHAASALIAGAIVLALAFSLASAVKLNLEERPLEYEVLGDSGAVHVCDAPEERLAHLEGVERPSAFCTIRAVLAGIGIPAESPGAAFQLVVPLLFIVMGVRFLANGMEAAAALGGSGEVAS